MCAAVALQGYCGALLRSLIELDTGVGCLEHSVIEMITRGFSRRGVYGQDQARAACACGMTSCRASVLHPCASSSCPLCVGALLWAVSLPALVLPFPVSIPCTHLARTGVQSLSIIAIIPASRDFHPREYPLHPRDAWLWWYQRFSLELL